MKFEILRSLIFTTLLLIFTVVLGVLVFWQIREGNLERLLGVPPVELGERIYPNFQPENVARILLRSGETEAVFIKTPKGWSSTSPWVDRMDYRATLAILALVNTTLAADRVERNKLDPDIAGLETGRTEVTCQDAFGEILAHFCLGRRTPLLHLSAGENSQAIPTTYLLPRERGRESHVYAATGDISPLFKDGFRRLRDHRPLQVNPLALGEIRIRTAEGELTLGRASTDAPWRIIKPLDLATDPATVKTLLEGLFDLEATKIADRSQMTLPTETVSAQNSQIALTHFGEEAETVLDIFLSETPEARETLATVSNRPQTVFTLPLKAEAEIVSIADLPLTVNDLRDPTLTNLNITSIRSIAIESATTPAILISRNPSKLWTVTISEKEQPANMQRLEDLLVAAVETRALSFDTDAAPEDLSPWGLDRPILTLVFLADNNQTLSISFGLDKRGRLFAKRKTSPTVMRIDNSFLEKIAVNAHDWRQARLWSFHKVDLIKLIRTEEGSVPLELSYDDRDESWNAARAGNNVTADLDLARANFILATLENLSVARWLAPNDEVAAKALAKPNLTFTAIENTIDDFGDISGTKTRTLTFATDPATNLIYGKISSDSLPFTLDPETFLKLSIPPLEE